jgi:glycosyltransferase involved in cell wall biosynthesis
MNIILFANPDFFADQKVPAYTSMPRYVRMLAEGMRARGHQVEIWSPKARFFRLPVNSIKKWLGYLDQYLVFPTEVKARLKKYPDDTLLVFTDQAQGPWVPLAGRYRHVIHCHDFLSQLSSMGKIPENNLGKSGKWYQKYIRNGFSKGKNFISVSYKTQSDLKELLGDEPLSSHVVYNAVNKLYSPHDASSARAAIAIQTGIAVDQGYIFHVGGNLWYKNRAGVIELYNRYRKDFHSKIPLIMLGGELVDTALAAYNDSPFKKDIHVLSGLPDEMVRYLYAGASVFLFPSLAEGFGWPIAEAMACGCPVITTSEAPMTEVAGGSGFFIPRRPAGNNGIEAWTRAGAEMIYQVINLEPQQRESIVEAGLSNIKRFDQQLALDTIEEIYKNISVQQSNIYDYTYNLKTAK